MKFFSVCSMINFFDKKGGRKSEIVVEIYRNEILVGSDCEIVLKDLLYIHIRRERDRAMVDGKCGVCVNIYIKVSKSANISFIIRV